MRIAVPYDNGKIGEHFGKTEAFKIYVFIDHELVGNSIEQTEGQGHDYIPYFLKEKGVDIVLCKNMGEGMMRSLSAVDIQFEIGITGDADAQVEAYAEGLK